MKMEDSYLSSSSEGSFDETSQIKHSTTDLLTVNRIRDDKIKERKNVLKALVDCTLKDFGYHNLYFMNQYGVYSKKKGCILYNLRHPKS